MSISQTLGSHEVAKKLQDESGRIILAGPPLSVTWLSLTSVRILTDLLAVASWQAQGKFREASEKIRVSLELAKGPLSFQLLGQK